MLKKYFDCYYRYNRLVSINAPDFILKYYLKKLLSIEKKLLKKQGIFIKNFIDSEIGKKLYRKHCDEIERFDSISERCNSCIYFSQKYINDDINFTCEKLYFDAESPYPDICNDFKYCGSSSIERLLKTNCDNCNFSKKTEDECICTKGNNILNCNL